MHEMVAGVQTHPLCRTLQGFMLFPALLPAFLVLSGQPDFEVLVERRGDLTAAQALAAIDKPNFIRGGELGFDPTRAEYFDRISEQLRLTKEEVALYRKNGLVVVDHAQRYSFGATYFAIYARDLPVLITTDSILHALHKSYDDILMELETVYLMPTIDSVLEAAHARVTKGDEDVDFYIAIARNLLAGATDELKIKTKFDQDAAVLAILAKIGDGQIETPDTGQTKIYGAKRMVDWTQFRPRGHYTKTEALKRYFKAMMWLGRADTGFEIADHPRQLTAAVRLVELIRDSEGLGRLRAMDDIVDFMVGKSDNLTAFALAEAIAKTKEPKALMALLAKNAHQKIRSQVVVSNPNDSIQVQPPKLFQLFGQRFVIDSFVLSKVVFDSILFERKKVRRMMPSGLDVMAALGNDEAVRLLVPEMMRFPYGKNLLASRDFVTAQLDGFWGENVYNGWLGALRTIDDRPRGKHFPRAMQTESWSRKQLQAQLGSWAELRHDTILYAKQSYTAYPSCEYPTGFVEPYPEFYAAIRSLANEAARRIRLANYGKAEGARSRHIDYFNGLARTMLRLEAIATKELQAKSLSSSDETWLKKTIDVRGVGSGPPRYDGWYVDLFYGGGSSAQKWDPTIADVHTDPKSQKVLEVGVGDVQFVVIAVDNEDDRTAYVGPVFSYYEFQHPVTDRLTDEKWQMMIHRDELPTKPFWTSTITGPRMKRHIGR